MLADGANSLVVSLLVLQMLNVLLNLILGLNFFLIGVDLLDGVVSDYLDLALGIF